jgi:hypothetical protein
VTTLLRPLTLDVVAGAPPLAPAVRAAPSTIVCIAYGKAANAAMTAAFTLATRLLLRRIWLGSSTEGARASRTVSASHSEASGGPLMAFTIATAAPVRSSFRATLRQKRLVVAGAS